MQNFIAHGNSIQLVAPAGGVTGGQLYRVNDFVGIPVASAAEDEEFTLSLRGAYEVDKTTGEAWAIGQKLYYVVATGKLTTTASTNIYAGKAFAAAASGDLVGQVLLDN